MAPNWGIRTGRSEPESCDRAVAKVAASPPGRCLVGLVPRVAVAFVLCVGVPLCLPVPWTSPSPPAMVIGAPSLPYLSSLRLAAPEATTHERDGRPNAQDRGVKTCDARWACLDVLCAWRCGRGRARGPLWAPWPVPPTTSLSCGRSETPWRSGFDAPARGAQPLPHTHPNTPKLTLYLSVQSYRPLWAWRLLPSSVTRDWTTTSPAWLCSEQSKQPQQPSTSRSPHCAPPTSAPLARYSRQGRSVRLCRAVAPE